MSTLPKHLNANEAVGNYADSGIEPMLCEVLDDPNIGLQSTGDEVTRDDLEFLIQSMRHIHFAGRPPTQH